MSMDTRAWALVLLILISLAGCDEPSGPVVPENYFPMELGDWWEYDQTVTRVFPDTSLRQEGTEEFLVVDITGDTCLVQRTLSIWYLNGEALEDTMYFVDSLRYVLNEDSVVFIQPEFEAVKILDLPLELGKTWDVYTVTGMGEDITTPAGVMENCAVVESYTTAGFGHYTFLVEETYCPAVGRIMLHSPNYQIVEAYILDVLYVLRGSSRL